MAGSLQQILSYNMATESSFTFTPTDVEFTATTARQFDQTPANSTFYAALTSTINGNWGNGTLTGTATGGAAISGSFLDLTGGTVKYVDYAANGNASHPQIGTIRFTLKPAYSGAPAAQRHLFTITSAAGSASNAMALYHRTDKTLLLEVRDSASILQINLGFGQWTPASGTSYEFELNYDFTNGATRLFINGAQVGTTFTNSFTRGSTLGLLRLGSNRTGTSTTDISIKDFLIFDTVQHTANYTPGAAPAATRYQAATAVNVVNNSGVRADAFESFAATSTASGSDTTTFIIQVDNVDMYWTGAAWATSNGTVAQSNTAADVNTNVAALDLSSGATLKVKVLLYSNDGTTSPSVTDVTLGYNFSIVKPTPNRVIIYGWLTESSNAGLSTATVQLQNRAAFTNGGLLVPKSEISTTTDANGYWELSVVETATVSKQYRIVFTYTDPIAKETKFDFTAPDQDSANIADLITT